MHDDLGTIAERAARGAALLDEIRPGWWRSVAFDQLAMDSCDQCVLGQVFGEYSDGLQALDAHANQGSKVRVTIDEDYYGFDLTDVEKLGDADENAAWEDLASAWRSEVAYRIIQEHGEPARTRPAEYREALTYLVH
jgi:hypothetical protein